MAEGGQPPRKSSSAPTMRPDDETKGSKRNVPLPFVLAQHVVPGPPTPRSARSDSSDDRAFELESRPNTPVQLTSPSSFSFGGGSSVLVTADYTRSQRQDFAVLNEESQESLKPKKHRVFSYDFPSLKSRFDVTEAARSVASSKKRYDSPATTPRTPTTPRPGSSKTFADSLTPTSGIAKKGFHTSDATVQAKKSFQKLVEDYGPLLQKKMTNGREFLLVTGCTGSGKSTVVPLALAKLLRSDEKMIIVTVPKRIAAQLLYARQTENAKAILKGNPVGYAMHKDSVKSSSTRLLYVTAGWLLALLSAAPNEIFSYSTVIVDECHERGSDTELLIGLLHKLQTQFKTKANEDKQLSRAPDKRKIFPKYAFLSATMKPKDILDHFRGDRFFKTSGFKRGACSLKNVVLDITTPMNESYNVTEVFLEELKNEPYEVDVENALREFMVGPYVKIRPIVPKVQEAVVDAFLDTLEVLCKDPKYSTGNVLVFVPGINEMGIIINRYKQSPQAKIRKSFEFVLFHSKLTPEEKSQVKIAANGIVTRPRKILLATNIAESSLTIPNLSMVFDFGLTKLTAYDMLADAQTLVLYWADQMSIQQRRGRAGRDRDGIYVYLGTEAHYHGLWPNPSDVERESLDDLVMKLLQMSENKAYENEPDFLYNFIMKHMLTHPDETNLMYSVGNLLSSEATIQKTDLFTRPKQNFHNIYMTKGGRVANLFPTLKRKLGLLIHMGGSIFLNTETVVYMAASEYDDLNEVFFREDACASVFKMKLRHSFGEPSDVKALLGLFKSWQGSSYLKRDDKQPKKSVAKTEPLRGFGVAERNRDLEEWELENVNTKMLTRMDDNAADIFNILKNNNIQIMQSKSYKEACASEYSDILLPQAKLNERIICSLLPVITAPFKTWFFSAPSYKKFDENKDKGLFLPNTLFLIPAPPLNFDLARYGPCIQEHYSVGVNQYPDVFIDHRNNRLVLSYPYCGRETYLGRCHPGVITTITATENRQAKDSAGSDFILRYVPLENSPKPPKGEPEFIAPPKIKAITSDTKVNVCNFINPYCFFVRDGGSTTEIQAFQDIYWMLNRASRKGFTKMTGRQAKLGQTCILLKPGSKEPPGLRDPKKKVWNHHHRRAIIHSEVGVEYEFIPENFKGHYKVLVESIDMGDYGYYELDNLFYYDEESCNYDLPELFSKFPRLAYRCVLESVLPVPCKGFNWPTEDIFVMSKELKDGDKDFRSLGYLDIIDSSSEDNLLVCADIWNLARKVSFKNWALEKKFCVVNDDQKIVDIRKRPPGPFYLNTPTTTPNFPSPIKEIKPKAHEKTQQLPYMEYCIREAYSPLQVTWTPCTDDMRKIGSVKMSKSSMNCFFLDPRMTIQSLENYYDPLLMIASESRYFPHQRDDYKSIIIDSSTVFPPVPGLVAIMAMLFQPVVTLYQDQDGTVFGVKIFKTMPGGKPEFQAHLPLKIILTDEDMTEIDGWRNMYNTLLIEGTGVDPEKLRDVLLRVVKKERQALTINYPVDVGRPVHGETDINRCIQKFHKVEIRMTTAETTDTFT